MAVNNRIAQLFHLGDSQLRPRHLVGIAPTPPPLDLLGTLSIADLWIGLAICHFKRSSPDRTQPRSGAIFTVPTGRYICFTASCRAAVKFAWLAHGCAQEIVCTPGARAVYAWCTRFFRCSMPVRYRPITSSNRSCGKPMHRFPSRPTMVSPQINASKIASSVASTTARNNPSIAPLVKNSPLRTGPSEA